MEPTGLCRIWRPISFLADLGIFKRGNRNMYKKTIATAAATLAAGLMLAASTGSASAQCGRASWYALHSKTASGERMNPSAMTAAHRSLPFGTKVKVTNKRNGKSVVVRINDRGPFIKGRVIDVSKGAAQKLGFISSGHTSICLDRQG